MDDGNPLPTYLLTIVVVAVDAVSVTTIVLVRILSRPNKQNSAKIRFVFGFISIESYRVVILIALAIKW